MKSFAQSWDSRMTHCIMVKNHWSGLFWGVDGRWGYIGKKRESPGLTFGHNGIIGNTTDITLQNKYHKLFCDTMDLIYVRSDAYEKGQLRIQGWSLI